MKKLIPAIFCLSLAGCARTVCVPLERVHTEYRDRLQKDSILMRDSIRIVEKGDTVRIESFRYVYRDRLVRDTVVRRDSIPYPVEIETIREVKHVPALYRWCFVFTVAACCFGAGRLFWRIRGGR